MCQNERHSGKLSSMAIWLLAALLLTACFREAPPCDQASLDKIKNTCKSVEECDQRLDDRASICEERIRSGE